MEFIAQYLNIPSLVGGKRNEILKKAIIHIGKHYGKLANKKGCRDEQYFKCGIKYIAKSFRTRRFGIPHFRRKAVSRMVNPSGKGPERTWHYHKRLYAKAFEHIENLLDNSNYDDFVETLYAKSCKNSGQGDKLERFYSNVLLFWQKNMLRTHELRQDLSPSNIEAGKISKEIKEVDKPLPNRSLV